MLISGLVALDRAAKLAEWEVALAERRASVNMSPDQVFAAYRGIDGQPWPSPPFSGWEDRGVVPLTELENVNAIVEAAGLGHSIDVVALVPGSDAGAMTESGWELLGYDIGYLESTYSHYSVLLHEVIYGIHSSLREHSRALNANLLLSSHDEGVALLDTRAMVAAAGGDIETVGHMSIVGVLRK